MTTLALAPPCEILPGDTLCYGGSGLFSFLIKVKTFAHNGITHVELANSASSAFASRNGRGVHTYPIDLDPKRLVMVLRCVTPLDMGAVRTFHSQCIGQSYDWVAILTRFFAWGKQSMDRQVCSEYWVRLLRHGGVEPFTTLTDADLVTPTQVPSSPALRLVWQREAR